MQPVTPSFGSTPGRNSSRPAKRRDSRTEMLGTKLDGGRYELLNQLGAGGVGVVYRGRQAPLGREVAIKVLRGQIAANSEGVAAFWREARAASLIDHHNVVRLIDFGHDERVDFFMVMELLAGKPLDDLLVQTRVPQLAWTCDIMCQVLAGIAAAHDQGVVHQDVKPANVLVCNVINSDGQPQTVAKLCDFGLATLTGVVTNGGRVVDGRRSLCGTPAYMSPEQVRCEPATASTDVYACGVMLYEMATGRLPFEGDSAMSLAVQRLKRPAPPPSEHRPDVDPQLQDVIMCALAIRPEDRFAHVRHMRVELMAIMRRAQGAARSGSGEGVDDEEDTRPFLALAADPRRASARVDFGPAGSVAAPVTVGPLAIGAGTLAMASAVLALWWLMSGFAG